MAKTTTAAKTTAQEPVTIESLRKYADYSQVVEIPNFEGDGLMPVRLRRTSLRGMLTAGKIPNTLMAAAQRLYEGTANSKASATFADVMRVMDCVVADAMVAPSHKDLRDADIELTEQQVTAIYAYAQQGAKALEPFRALLAGADAGDDGAPVQTETK